MFVNTADLYFLIIFAAIGIINCLCDAAKLIWRNKPEDADDYE